jgi:hypothetical protein
LKGERGIAMNGKILSLIVVFVLGCGNKPGYFLSMDEDGGIWEGKNSLGDAEDGVEDEEGNEEGDEALQIDRSGDSGADSVDSKGDISEGTERAPVGPVGTGGEPVENEDSGEEDTGLELDEDSDEDSDEDVESDSVSDDEALDTEEEASSDEEVDTGIDTDTDTGEDSDTGLGGDTGSDVDTGDDTDTGEGTESATNSGEDTGGEEETDTEDTGSEVDTSACPEPYKCVCIGLGCYKDCESMSWVGHYEYSCPGAGAVCCDRTVQSTDTGENTDTGAGSDIGTGEGTDTGSEDDSDTASDTGEVACDKGVWEGDYDVRDYNFLVGVSLLAGYTEVTGRLFIKETLVDDLSGVECLEKVGGRLYIQDADDIVNVDELSNLTEVGGLIVAGNELLEDLDGLGSLASTAVYGINIFENDALTSLDGLRNIRGLSNMLVYENPVLGTLGRFVTWQMAYYASKSLRVEVKLNPELPKCEVDEFIALLEKYDWVGSKITYGNDEDAVCE